MNIPLHLLAAALDSRTAQVTVPDGSIPLSAGWVSGFLVIVLWLFIAAILIGPLVNALRIGPRTNQIFVDDRSSGHR